jgi:hypothetical protein
MPITPSRNNGLSKTLLLLAGVTFISLAAYFFYVSHSVKDPFVSDVNQFPVDIRGYDIETLPVNFVASFVRGDNVYFATAEGRIFYGRDDKFLAPFNEIPSPISSSEWPTRIIFESSSGTLFLSTKKGPVFRSDDRGRNWRAVLASPGWRIDEVKPGVLVIGNYPRYPSPKPEQFINNPRGATIFLSRDDGRTWTPREICARCQHVHSVRWDEQSNRLYVAYGDGEFRGEGYIEMETNRLFISGEGPGHGHTDVAFTRDYIFWGSDDGTGRVLREDRKTGRVNTLMNGPIQNIWWIITYGNQIYIGTMPGRQKRSAVLASGDQGETWQKILESRPARRDYDRGFESESRNGSNNGWVYCSNGEKAFRFRRSNMDARVAGK